MSTATKATHTPGPWTAEDVNMPQSWDFSRVVGPKQEEIADIDNTGLDREEEKANARLIAAAPEMLEALERMVHAWDLKLSQNLAIEQCQAAIRKAQGEQ